MSQTAHITYRSLYAITERRPQFQSLSLLTDMGIPAASEAGSRNAMSHGCRIVMLAGPDSDDINATDGIRPRWRL